MTKGIFFGFHFSKASSRRHLGVVAFRRYLPPLLTAAVAVNTEVQQPLAVESDAEMTPAPKSVGRTVRAAVFARDQHCQ
jgi:hypothetical protein